MKISEINQVAFVRVGDVVMKRYHGEQQMTELGTVTQLTRNSKGKLVAVLDRSCRLRAGGNHNPPTNRLTQAAFSGLRLFVRRESAR